MGALLSLARWIGLLGRGAAVRPTATGTTKGGGILGGLRALLRLLTGPPPPPPSPPCPICMEPVPTASSRGPNDGAVALRCGHSLCRDCVAQYVEIKIRDRQVETDQLVCPVVECKRRLSDIDLRNVLRTPEAFNHYLRTLQRVRDEKNPLARWCPRPQCGQLILSAPGAHEFTCPACATVGCVHCRGPRHVFAFLCRHRRGRLATDAAFSRWAATIGHRAVRACPKCHMPIWKSGGCNHMTCTQCRHEYCWVCDVPWQRRHYACREPPRRWTSAMAGAARACFDWLVHKLVAGLETLGALVARVAWCVAFVVLFGVAVVVRVATSVGALLPPRRPRQVTP